MGGSKELARTILHSRLRTDFKNNDFWSKVILFFTNQADLDYSQVNPIIDYIFARRFPNGENGDQNENFTLKGKNITTIFREMERWHIELRNRRFFHHEVFSWEGSAIGRFPY